MKICLNVNCNTVYSFINVNMSNLVFYYIYEYVQVMEKVCILWTLRRSHRSALVKKCANLEYMNVILSLKENANVQKSTHLWILLEQKPERRADKSCSWTEESTACWVRGELLSVCVSSAFIPRHWRHLQSGSSQITPFIPFQVSCVEVRKELLNLSHTQIKKITQTNDQEVLVFWVLWKSTVWVFTNMCDYIGFCFKIL